MHFDIPHQAFAPFGKQPPPTRWTPSEDTQLVTPERFRERALAEATRHGRYLSGVGIIRIGPRHGRLGREALREAVETETRRTDATCSYPDGSHAVLAVNADSRALEALARRLASVAREIAKSRREEAEYVSGAASAEEQRLTADELWVAANDAYEIAVETAGELVFARWD
jgi:hypothetical protein